MLKRVKISTRILFTILGVLIVFASSGLVYMQLHTEVAPNAFDRQEAERYFYFNKLKNIDIRRGFWNVELIASDKNFVKVEGGLRLLNYYLLSEQSDTGIVLSLSDSIKEDYIYEFSLKVYTNSLQNIYFNAAANMLIDSLDFDLLNVRLKGNSILQMRNCRVERLNINAFNQGTFESEMCRFESVLSSMYDSSYAFLYSAENVKIQARKDFSMLMIYNDETKNSTAIVSDSVKQLSNRMPEYIDGVKWLMPFTKPITLEVFESLDNDSIEYNYLYWEEPHLSPERHLWWMGYAKDNRQTIYIEDADFFGIRSRITLSYFRGFLNKIYFYFDEESYSDSLSDVITHKLIERFGRAMDISESEYKDYRYADLTQLWRDSTGIQPNKFTEIYFDIRLNIYAGIEISSPFFNEYEYWESYRYYWYSTLRLFMSY